MSDEYPKQDTISQAQEMPDQEREALQKRYKTLNSQFKDLKTQLEWHEKYARQGRNEHRWEPHKDMPKVLDSYFATADEIERLEELLGKHK